ncbi:MAG: serine hydrolase [Rubrobacteraceae bacterium]
MKLLESRRELKRRRRRVWWRRNSRRLMWVFFAVLFCLTLFFALLGSVEPEPISRVEVPVSGSQLAPPSQPSPPPPPVVGGDLEDRLLALGDAHPGEYGVAVYDARSGRTVGVNAQRPMEAASLAKLPVLLTLYKEAAGGGLDLDEGIVIQASDIQSYGTGVLHNYPVGYEMTLRECAWVMIKESDNTAWAMLERRLGKDRISRELDSLGAGDTDYGAYRTTPEDVLLVLRAISDPRYTNPRLSSEMLGAMTDTAHEDRLPEPLPEDVRVAHKVGSVEDTYSDAGVVFSDGMRDAEDGYYVVAVVSGGMDEEAAEGAIREVSLTTYRSLRPDSD